MLLHGAQKYRSFMGGRSLLHVQCQILCCSGSLKGAQPASKGEGIHPSSP